MKSTRLRWRALLSSSLLWWSGAALVSSSCAHSEPAAQACDEGDSRCGDTCVGTLDDPKNCGACGNACPEGQTCEQGACVGSSGSGGGGGDGCTIGQTACAGGCVDLAIDPANCGACDRACPRGFACQSGICACPEGLSQCGEGCVNLQTDTSHCGDCDTACPPSQVCERGACGCIEGLTDCGGSCVDVLRSTAHCGGCEVACDPGSFCREGACSCLVDSIEDLGDVVPQVVTGTTMGGSYSYDLGCLAAGSTQRVYRFTAREDGAYSFDTQGSAFDTTVGVLDVDGCGELACNDDLNAEISQSRATAILRAGDVVLVVVTGFNGAEGEFSLNVFATAPPMCPVDDIDPVLPQAVAGDTSVSGDAISPSCGPAGYPDASYTFTAPSAGRYVFDTFGSGYDTVLELRNGSCDGPVITCNDDYMGDQSRVTALLSAGQTVVAIVDGVGGPFTLNVTEYVAPPCPTYDLDTTSFPIAVSGDTTGFEDSVATTCGGSGGHDATYRFTAPETALYTFDTFGSAFNTILHIHEGSCAGASLACNDNTMGSQSQARVLLDAAQTVVVVVDGYGSGAQGPYTLNVSQTFVPPCPAIDLGSTEPQTVTGTTVGLVDALAPGCGGSGSPEATFAFTAPMNGTYIFDTFGSSFDTALSIIDAACGGSVLRCNNNANGGTQSRAVVDLVADQTVIAVVDGNSSTSGDYVLNVARFDGGGTCSTAIELGSAIPQIATGTTLGQPDSVTPACAFSSAPDVVYSFTAPSDGIFFFETGGSSYDTVVHVHDGSCEGATLGCNDNAFGLQSRASASLVAGQAVFVVVDGYSSNAGDYALSVSRFDGVGVCGAPIDLGGVVPQTVTGTTAGMPNVHRPSCGLSNAGELVYTFTAPVDATFEFNTFGSSFDTVLDVRDTASCVGTSLRCNDDSGGLQSRVTVALAAGQVVMVVVDGYSAASGSVTLNVLQL